MATDTDPSDGHRTPDDADPPAPQERSPEAKPLVVALGASAGGLKALEAFFEHLPKSSGICFVVIMHLDPEHESELAGILQSKVQMPVTQVAGRVPIAPDRAYVIPPNKQLELTDEHIGTAAFEAPRGQRRPIDHFFRSVARRGEPCGSIVFSGSGTDGSRGVGAVKEAGGLVLAQAPEDAEYPSMPQNAINTGLMDVILPAAELGVRLVELSTHVEHLPSGPDDLGDGDRRVIRQILARVRERTGNDFSQYKRSTVLRRILRRVQINRKSDLEEYLAFVRSDPGEVEALVKELLISVTTFFRDAEAFEALAERVVPALFEGKDSGDTVRAWVAGCATGEEAYSVAILLAEHAATLDHPPAVQLFASDMDEAAVARARQGLYPLAIEADVTKERLARFFERKGDQYSVSRELRDRIVFASHSLLRDPPFSRLDLVTCRNVLIYLQRELQDRVYEVFHYALQPRGYLFLGSAETTDQSRGLFQQVDREHRIYQAKKRTGEYPVLPTLSHHSPQREEPHGTPPSTRAAPPERGLPEEGEHRRALEAHAPPSLLVDEDQQVVHLSERVGRYLEPAGGRPGREAVRLVRPEFRGELRSALYQAFEKGRATVARPIAVQFNGEPQTVYLTVRLHRDGDNDDAERLALVLFNEADEDARAAAGAPEGAPPGQLDAEQIEEELRHTRERLRATVEESEAAREELKAQNEELRSINEEYKSTTEELETSKEEVQSVNEELHSVNEELQKKLEEVSRANSDLQNLMEATRIGTLFLDRDLKIKRYTPAAQQHFNLQPADLGRPISHLMRDVDYDGLEADARQVLRDLRPIERKVQGGEDCWYLAQIRPYRTVDDKIDGVVLTFVDITALKEAEAQLARAKEYAESIVDTAREGLLVLDDGLRVESANTSFYQLFETTPQATVGERIYELGNGHWDLPELRRLLEQILPKNSVFDGYEVDHEFEGIGRRTMLLNARRLRDHERIFLAIQDITERAEALRALEELNETLETRVKERTKEVHERERHLKALVEASAQIVWTADADGYITEASASWEAFTGQSFAEYSGLGYIAAAHPADRTAAKNKWQQAIETQAPFDTEARLYHAESGDYRWMHVRGVPLFESDGTLAGWVGMNIDIDERRRATERVHELALALTEAEERERRRVAEVLHDDVQQDLYAAQITARGTRRRLKDTVDEESFAEVKEACDKLEALLDQAFKATRSLSTELSPTVLNEKDLHHVCLWLAEHMHERYGLTVEIDVEGNARVESRNLRTALLRTLRELLFNVVKHAETKRARIEVRAATDRLTIRVRDEGKGFDLEHLEDQTKSYGLSHVRERIHLLGGRLQLESEPGAGTCITLSLPLDTSSSQPPSP